MGYLNGLNLKVSEGKYAGYSIKFDLEFRRGGTIEESEQKAQKRKNWWLFCWKSFFQRKQ